jgi:hypothetical protein
MSEGSFRIEISRGIQSSGGAMETNVRTGQIAAGLASITGAVWEIVHEARAVEPKSSGSVVDEVWSGIVELGQCGPGFAGSSDAVVG